MANEEELESARRAHAALLREHGSQPYPNDFRVTEAMEARRKELLALSADETRRALLPGEDGLNANSERFPLYGRVVAKRGPFLVVRTPYGDAQALVRPENLSVKDAALLEVVDLADHVYCEGPAMKTRTGALALRADRYQHVGKALLPPPAKWHGLKDVEKRYRERYVDLFANPEVAGVFRARARIITELRRFLDGRGFVEVETPQLVSLRGGATARPFTTHHNALDMSLFLRIAPELFLKRLLVGGFDRVYEIGRTFRNEGVSTKHNPEFTMLEFYQAYATYEDLMDLTEEMLSAVDRAVIAEFPEFEVNRGFSLERPWARVKMRDIIAERIRRAGQGSVNKTRWSEVLNDDVIRDPQKLAHACATMLPRLDEAAQKHLSNANSYGEQIFALYELLAEAELPNLYRTTDGSRSRPVFITEYPFEVSPLSRKSDHTADWVDRFELFIEGREMANAFSELNDPDDQASRFEAQLVNREKGDEEAMDFDADYIRALRHGMPPAGGLGLGIDRFVMLLCNQPSIRDVLLFPLLKPEATE